MKQILSNYELVAPIPPGNYAFTGNSVGNKRIVGHVFADATPARSLLDIGFGVGDLAHIVKSDPRTQHWSIDGIDGFGDVCCNASLFEKKFYRNVWHGLAQELPAGQLQQYDAICLFDVIEHLDAAGAKALLKNLLESLGPDSRLVMSTPLWFWPQSQQNPGDLEEHLIAIPSSSLMRLAPLMFTIDPRFFVGTFVFSRRSLALLDHFQPISDKRFGLEAGRADLQAIGRGQCADGVLYVVSDH